MKNSSRNKRKRIKDKPAKKLVEIPSPDEAVLNLLRSKDINLSKPRLVHFYLYFPSQEKAESAASELNKASFEVEVIEPLEIREGWLCLATKEILLNDLTMTNLRKKFDNLTRKFNGKYDGWETGISPDESEGLL